MNDEQPIVLAPTYYLEHWQYLLDFVQRHYEFLLIETERSLLKKFTELSIDARCLFVRLINRRIRYFKLTELGYAEIINLEQAVAELIANKFVSWVTPTATVEIEQLLAIFTKTELIGFAQQSGLTLAKSLSKAEINFKITTEIPITNWLQTINRHVLLLTPLYQAEIQMLRFLFFGSLRADMTRFVVRDLGHVKLQSFAPTSFTPRYAERRVAEDCLAVQLALQEFKVYQSIDKPIASYQWFQNWHDAHLSLAPEAQPSMTKLILRLAGYLEKANLAEQALTIYALTEHPPSLERQIRLLNRLGQVERAKQLCERLIQVAKNADEYYFAKDFKQKLNSSTIRRSTTAYLANTQIVKLAFAPQTKPEQAAIVYLQRQGNQALYTENYVWRALFGLLFWDIIFDPKLNILHSPLQTAPSDLYLPNFFTARQQALLTRLDLLVDKNHCLNQLQLSYNTLFGIANPIISWYDGLWDAIVACYRHVSVAQLAAVLIEMAKDWRHNSCGFPDLMSWNEKDYAFIEVKSPNDHLSAQQLKWLEFFKQQGIHAEVLRIRWLIQE
ncbi:MAG: hypothetical protein K0S11_696 [Gammaproteobacteria bacterium]|jgi:hypothetical protein|nr:hypothetical protein [Gammaproteobacteria bacterium]